MKKNLPVTQREVTFKPHEHLVSTTDTKGIITSVNDTFVRVSGFAREELIGKNHNIIRHPDMPPLIFHNMWAMLKQGKPWVGVIKNRCKNGDLYWVQAYVSAIFDQGEVTGYQSVRTPAQPKHIRRAQRIYQDINRHRGQLGLMGRISHALNYRLLNVLMLFASFVVMGGIGYTAGVISGMVSAMVVGVGLLVSIVSGQLQAMPLKRLSTTAKQFADNDLVAYILSSNGREIATVEYALLMIQAKFNTVISRIGDSARQVNGSAHRASEGAASTYHKIIQQQQEIAHVATAITQITTTLQSVASNTNETADMNASTCQMVDNGKVALSRVYEQIESLSQKLDNSSNTISQLSQEVQGVDSVLQLIENISEQTNLLALNAAIEAARAGEHGRGFAVVADEVRTLATRTQESTRNIKQMSSDLSSGMERAVEEIRSGSSMMESVLNETRGYRDSLDQIIEASRRVADMNTQIASATEQQSMTIEEINRNIGNINLNSEETAEGAERARAAATELQRTAAELETLVRQVKS